MDLYEVLGVRRGATRPRSGGRTRSTPAASIPTSTPATRWRPEVRRPSPRAFEVLSDPQRRAQYDRGEVRVRAPPARPRGRLRRLRLLGRGAGGRVGLPPDLRRRARRRAPPPPTPAARTSSRRRRCPSRSRFRGTRRRVNVVRLGACGACAGAGDVAVRSLPCPRAAGRGTSARAAGAWCSPAPAPSAAAAAVGAAAVRALRRRGAGHAERVADVEIPAGAGDGTRVRLPGSATPGAAAARAGDFLLVVRVEPHPLTAARATTSSARCRSP